MSLQHAPIGWLEVLDRSGRVVERRPVGEGTVTVGRALDNDLILDDPFVCPHHLQVQVTAESMEVRDLDSLNGTWQGRRRITESEWGHQQRLTLGHSTLRFRAISESAAPAWPDVTSRGWLSLLTRGPVLAGALILALLCLTYNSWLEETRALSTGILANKLAYPLLALLFWAGLWSVINRIVSHRANFSVHLAIGSLALAALVGGDEVILMMSFAMDWHSLAPLLKIFWQILITGLALFAHMQFLAHGRRVMQAMGATALSFMLYGSPAMEDWLRRDDFNSLPALNPLLKPPGMRLVPGQDVDGFLEEAQRLRIQLDRAPD